MTDGASLALPVSITRNRVEGSERYEQAFLVFWFVLVGCLSLLGEELASNLL
jgi:hypothetical protein